MLLRRLTHVVLLSALAAGCNQSLFDDGTGGGGDDPDSGPRPDAREGTPDANPGAPDADLVLPGDGGVLPDDGSVPLDADPCSGACIDDDAYEDFDGFQGGATQRWRYVEFQPETDSYEDMAPIEVNGFPGFVGTGTPAPSLAFCLTTSMPPCTGLTPGLLALTTTASGAHHPGVSWAVPYSGTYSVSVIFTTAPDAPDIPATVALAQNNQSNILQSKPLDDTTGLYVEVPFTAGDVLVVSVLSESETSVSVGVNVVVTGPYGGQ